jgi:hypothetical protein
MNRKILCVVMLLVILGTVAVVAATYTMTSNTITITPVAQFTLTLTSNTTTPVVGETIRLTATCNDATFSGVVTFGSLGQITAVNGIATKDYVVPTIASISVTATATHP